MNNKNELDDLVNRISRKFPSEKIKEESNEEQSVYLEYRPKVHVRESTMKKQKDNS